jgi:hypothetical protein
MHAQLLTLPPLTIFYRNQKKIKNNHEKSYKMLNDQSGENKKGIG